MSTQSVKLNFWTIEICIVTLFTKDTFIFPPQWHIFPPNLKTRQFDKSEMNDFRVIIHETVQFGLRVGINTWSDWLLSHGRIEQPSIYFNLCKFTIFVWTQKNNYYKLNISFVNRTWQKIVQKFESSLFILLCGDTILQVLCSRKLCD